jgi:pantoate--beta-alanine ligase
LLKAVHKIRDVKSALEPLQRQGLSVGFVPTMGALHEGHLSLIRKSKSENALTALSIYVNPTQFGPGEDFEKYPKDLERDLELASKEKVDLVYLAETEEIYPKGFSTFVEETELSKVLCGAHRPGHFRGVCTVVFRLFQIVSPDRAYFGTKDAQQLRIVQKMVEDLDLPVVIVPCPTHREKDGLAMSSRNRYLSPEERVKACALYQALGAAHSAFDQGERSARKLLETAKDRLNTTEGIRLQYLELRRWNDLRDVDTIEKKSILAIAAYLGSTRLIDNVIIDPTV